MYPGECIAFMICVCPHMHTEARGMYLLCFPGFLFFYFQTGFLTAVEALWLAALVNQQTQTSPCLPCCAGGAGDHDARHSPHVQRPTAGFHACTTDLDPLSSLPSPVYTRVFICPIFRVLFSLIRRIIQNSN